MAMRWCTVRNKDCLLFTFLALLMAPKGGATGIGKTKNQLTYVHAPSRGEILN